MAHDTHTNSSELYELTQYSRQAYLDMTNDWKDPLGDLVIEDHYNEINQCNVKVVRDDLHDMGTKGRAGDLLVRNMANDTIVYVAPRVGFAAMSLAALGKKYGKRVILFCPSSKKMSDHQAIAMAHGAELRFVRIAAMPNLNKIAAQFAEDNGYMFAPFGLRHPLVTAVLAKCGNQLVERLSGSHALWSVISTGVLSRGLQIGINNRWDINAIAVARNIKKGEKGDAVLQSHEFPFVKSEHKDLLPPFPTVNSYDAKAWKFIKPGPNGETPVFWNVAKEPVLTDYAKRLQDCVDSAREWGDKRDLMMPEVNIIGTELEMS